MGKPSLGTGGKKRLVSLLACETSPLTETFLTVALDRIRAAENGNAPPSRPYQIAVLRHDDLCPSNGPERINEERGNYPSFHSAHRCVS